MLELLLADRSSCNESANTENFGCIADERGVVKYRIAWGQRSGQMIVIEAPYKPSLQELFFRLNNYVVSSQASGQYFLVPRKT